MNELITALRVALDGGVHHDIQTRRAHARDASIYELVPDLVIAPKHARDVERVVQYVNKHKELHPKLAITPRSAGTDMSGAAIGHSIVLDMTTHFKEIHGLTGTLLHAQPGAYVRDIDPLINRAGYMLGSVPASRALCTIGGMVGNNAGGEQSLRFGNTEEMVRELKVVLADGKEYTIAPLTKRQLERKIKEKTYESELYRQVYELIEANYDLIKNARPPVNKNSMGYNLWSVWDRGTGIFDLTRLFTGSQGTLGIITDIKIEVVPKPKHTGLLLLYLNSMRQLDRIIPAVMKHKPATFEGFDDITFNLGIRHFKTFKKQLGLKEWAKQQAWLLKSVARFRSHLPGLVLMVQFEGNTPEEVSAKILRLHKALKPFKLRSDIESDERSSAPFWSIRRASLALLRTKIHDKYAAPFMDDMTVQPKYLPQFLPEVRKIIRKYHLPATLSGHFGDGNFHIIPLLDITSRRDQAKLEPAMRELIPLVLKYKGTMAGEHNDGMVRGPWLPAVFGDEMYQLFKQTKEIFDPAYIFNPHKKTDASWEYSMDHLRTSNNDGLIK